MSGSLSGPDCERGGCTSTGRDSTETWLRRTDSPLGPEGYAKPNFSSIIVGDWNGSWPEAILSKPGPPSNPQIGHSPLAVPPCHYPPCRHAYMHTEYL
jgi:hypothetical protein